ncbi:TIGR03089 family protein [Pseudonocardia bannensis]|uniref:TIGR03089 family protein n=1 Tax=Pseudonocardia bannensis TaxID=630973 RepID=A0A848DQT4_9PSEU|nr:TIGR03089 family protein [Pseudonocardia bannensis]NMH94751.1 TIGR03089 family protein [Pseudonocardia bannensis]
MTLTAALLEPALAGNPARPLITFYDDATGERIELSAITTANWAAKAANLLRDECDVEPGTPVAVLLPAHWQTAAVLLAIWWCGGQVVAEPGEAEWVLCDADRVDLALAAEPDGGVIALSLDAFGRGLPGLPAGVIDFATEVRLQGDEFVPWDEVPDDAPALAGGSVADVLTDAHHRATALGVSVGDRVLSTLDWSSLDCVLDGLLAVLAAGASLVQCRNADPAKLDHRADTEKTTVRLT